MRRRLAAWLRNISARLDPPPDPEEALSRSDASYKHLLNEIHLMQFANELKRASHGREPPVAQA